MAKRKNDDRLDIILFIGAMVFGGMIVFLFTMPSLVFGDIRAEKLGTAICQEMFGEDAEFKSLRGETLECEKPEATEQYDGLKVRLG